MVGGCVAKGPTAGAGADMIGVDSALCWARVCRKHDLHRQSEGLACKFLGVYWRYMAECMVSGPTTTTVQDWVVVHNLRLIANGAGCVRIRGRRVVARYRNRGLVGGSSVEGAGGSSWLPPGMENLSPVGR